MLRATLLSYAFSSTHIHTQTETETATTEAKKQKKNTDINANSFVFLLLYTNVRRVGWGKMGGEYCFWHIYTNSEICGFLVFLIDGGIDYKYSLSVCKLYSNTNGVFLFIN